MAIHVETRLRDLERRYGEAADRVTKLEQDVDTTQVQIRGMTNHLLKVEGANAVGLIKSVGELARTIESLKEEEQEDGH